MFGIFKKKDELFPIGSIIICIDDRDWNGCTNIELLYNKKYKVLDINKEFKSYDIGGRFNDPKQFTTIRNNTNQKIPGQGIHWAGSFRFRKATPQEEQEYYSNMKGEIQDQINSLVLKEEYEEAAELQKQLI